MAIKGIGDPTRDAQREANKHKRKPEPIKADQTPQRITAVLTRIKHLEELRLEAFDRSQLDPESAQTFDSDIVEMNGQNRIIGDLTFDLLDFLDGLSGGSFRSSQAELKVAEYLEGWIVKPDTVRELYAID